MRRFYPWESDATGIGISVKPREAMDSPITPESEELARRRMAGMPPEVRSALGGDIEARDYSDWRTFNRIPETVADTPEMVQHFLGKKPAPNVGDITQGVYERGAEVGRMIERPNAIAWTEQPAGVSAQEVMAQFPPRNPPPTQPAATEPADAPQATARPPVIPAGAVPPLAVMEDRDGDGIPDGAQVTRKEAQTGPDGRMVTTTAKWTKGGQGDVRAIMGDNSRGEWSQVRRNPVTAASVMGGHRWDTGVTGYTQGVEDLLVGRGLTSRDTGARQIAENILGARRAVVGREDMLGQAGAERQSRYDIERMKTMAPAEAQAQAQTWQAGQDQLKRAHELELQKQQIEAQTGKKRFDVAEVDGQKFIVGASGAIERATPPASQWQVGQEITPGWVVTGIDQATGQPQIRQARTEGGQQKPLDARDQLRQQARLDTIQNRLDELAQEEAAGNKKAGPDWWRSESNTFDQERKLLEQEKARLQGVLHPQAAASSPAAQGAEPNFATAEQAEAAGLPRGSIVRINGRRARIN